MTYLNKLFKEQLTQLKIHIQQMLFMTRTICLVYDLIFIFIPPRKIKLKPAGKCMKQFDTLFLEVTFIDDNAPTYLCAPKYINLLYYTILSVCNTKKKYIMEALLS